MGIFNADVIINIPPAFFSLQKSGLVRVYLTSVFLLLSVPRCFGDQKPQFDSHYNVQFTGYRQGKYWYPIERLNCNDLINEFEATQRKRSLGNDSLSSKPLKAPKRKKQF